MAIRIYIDQGHNPQNPNAGAEGNGLREQDITYRVGKALGELLRADGNFEVRESRPTPTTALGSSNTTSLHTNASSNAAATGTEAFVYSTASPAYRLAQDIVVSLSEATGLRDRGVFARPGLYVLRRTAMPALLLEMGFITNPGDARLMYENPGLFARGIYNGIRRYFGLS